MLNTTLTSYDTTITNIRNKYLSETSLAAIDYMVDMLLVASNNVSNAMTIVDSWYSNINGKTDGLVQAYCNAYSNLTPAQIASLPIFQPGTCVLPSSNVYST
jgi:hypothetical protein